MQRYSDLRLTQPRGRPIGKILNWLEKRICGIENRQNVVGNRKDEFGTPLTALMSDNNNFRAHMCPFVRDSLDFDLFWIEESDIDNARIDEIEPLLRSQMADFKNEPPAYDPATTGNAAEVPVLWKTSLTYFPDLEHESRAFPEFDDIHTILKPDFIRGGLMLGQFYAGCPTAAIYNPLYTGPLFSPYPCFAIRYMAKHDHLFIPQGTPEYAEYKKFF